MSRDMALRLYPVTNYIINAKAANNDAENKEEKFLKMKEDYAREGMRRAIHAVVLVNSHGHPHILLLEVNGNEYRLPGGELTPGETEAVGMNRVLNEVFGLDDTSAGEWPIVDRLATWWRPYFDPNCYPYVPVHCTKPKEQDSIHLIQLPEKCTFTVPKNYKLQAIPLYMLYEDKAAYGSVVSTLPQLLSRFTMTTI